MAFLSVNSVENSEKIQLLQLHYNCITVMLNILTFAQINIKYYYIRIIMPRKK